jgi:membrane protein YqaA with SNARE-associated domain
MIKSSFIALWSGTAFILLGIALTGQQSYLGSLVGYWVGFGYTEWIRIETLRSSELDVRSALNRMRRGLLARLGIVTLVVVTVARFQASWLFSLAIGIATGVILSFIIVAINKINGERGDKRSE